MDSICLSCLSHSGGIPMVFIVGLLVRQKVEPRVLVEKIPFFMASLLFGLIATNIQAGGDFHGMIHAIGEQKQP
jgi:hypothetical protein